MVDVIRGIVDVELSKNIYAEGYGDASVDGSGYGYGDAFGTATRAGCGMGLGTYGPHCGDGSGCDPYELEISYKLSSDPSDGSGYGMNCENHG